MLEYADRIKPLLLKLDEQVDILRPVLVEDHLVPLFTQHSRFDSILLYPRQGRNISGIHVSDTESKTVHIFYRACPAHAGEELEPSCPGCQTERFIVAKELVHTLDSDEQRTPPDKMAKYLLDQLLKGEWFENHQVKADGMASFWGIELLARYRHRMIATGNFGKFQQSGALASARANEDYSYLARQYAIPQGIAQLAFSDRYMTTMRDIREHCGLPLT